MGEDQEFSFGHSDFGMDIRLCSLIKYFALGEKYRIISIQKVLEAMELDVIS